MLRTIFLSPFSRSLALVCRPGREIESVKLWTLVLRSPGRRGFFIVLLRRISMALKTQSIYSFELLNVLKAFTYTLSRVIHPLVYWHFFFLLFLVLLLSLLRWKFNFPASSHFITIHKSQVVCWSKCCLTLLSSTLFSFTSHPLLSSFEKKRKWTMFSPSVHGSQLFLFLNLSFEKVPRLYRSRKGIFSWAFKLRLQGKKKDSLNFCISSDKYKFSITFSQQRLKVKIKREIYPKRKEKGM